MKGLLLDDHEGTKWENNNDLGLQRKPQKSAIFLSVSQLHLSGTIFPFANARVWSKKPGNL